MKKIPTVFVRDPQDMRYVTREVHPNCQWVLDGEGVATRKYDGTCVMFDGSHWWARREVKPGKPAPANYRPIETDENTGKTVGWEPIERSGFAKWFAEALDSEYPLLDSYPIRGPVALATYELLGPKVNGDPEKVGRHMLVRHGYCAAVDAREMRFALNFDSLADWLRDHPAWEGIVWHHPDGRMAKLKGRDFPRLGARLVRHTPVWRPAPLRVDAAGNTRPGFICVHELENGNGPCGGNVFNLADAVGDHSCVVPKGRISAEERSDDQSKSSDLDPSREF